MNRRDFVGRVGRAVAGLVLLPLLPRVPEMGVEAGGASEHVVTIDSSRYMAFYVDSWVEITPRAYRLSLALTGDSLGEFVDSPA